MFIYLKTKLCPFTDILFFAIKEIIFENYFLLSCIHKIRSYCGLRIKKKAANERTIRSRRADVQSRIFYFKINKCDTVFLVARRLKLLMEAVSSDALFAGRVLHVLADLVDGHRADTDQGLLEVSTALE